MPRLPRRPLPVLAAVAGLALAGCGGAGYGDPIAATDGDPATVALAPSPTTTPVVTTTGTTTAAPAAGAAPGSSGSGSSAAAGGEGSDGDAAGGTSGGTGGSGGSDGTGSSGSGDGGIAAYASDANRFCTGFNDATRTLTTRIAAAGASNPKALGRAIVQYGTAIDAAARGLRAAPPPSAVASYHRRTLDWVSGVTSAIRANRSGLQGGDAGAGAQVIGTVQRLGKPPAAPSAVRSRAAACAR
jgi:hypothetical protein